MSGSDQDDAARRRHRVAQLMLLGMCAEDAGLVDDVAREQARKAFDYGRAVVKALLPERLHQHAGIAYVLWMASISGAAREALRSDAGKVRPQ